MKRVAWMAVVLLSAGLLMMESASRTGAIPAFAQVPSRSVQFTYVVHVPALPGGSRELRLWIPLPYEDLYQLVSQLRVESPVPYQIRREPEYGDRYVYMSVDAARAKTAFDVRITFHAQRVEHRILFTAMSNIPAHPIVSTARFLEPDRLVPIDGAIADLSRQVTETATLPLDKARKAYDYVIATMHYDHDGTEWGRGDAIWACSAKHGNCTDFHSLFIGIARAAGVPARFEIGFSLPMDSHEGAIASYHCWAEFYADGIGWVPIDASEAWKHKEKQDYFFGATDQNRIMFSLGRDIRLNPPQKGSPLNFFVYPYAELDGNPFTDLKTELSFRDDEAPAAGRSVAGAMD